MWTKRAKKVLQKRNDKDVFMKRAGKYRRMSKKKTKKKREQEINGKNRKRFFLHEELLLLYAFRFRTSTLILVDILSRFQQLYMLSFFRIVLILSLNTKWNEKLSLLIEAFSSKFQESYQV